MYSKLKRIIRALGYDNANNEMISSRVVANKDGSLFERVEYLQAIADTLSLRCVAKTDGAILAAVDPIFTITGGMVRARIVGIVTQLIVGNSNLRLQHITTDPAATVDLNAGAVAVNDDAVGTIYYNVGASSVFTPTAGLGFGLVDPVTVDETYFLLAPGVVQCLGSAARVGVIAWYMTYEKLSPDSVVVAAD